jgi:O-antigen ligase
MFGGIVLIGADKFMLERLQDQENVDFRLNLYTAGFEMFMEKPLLGWGINQTPFLITKYLTDYKDDVAIHNTYFEILLEQGALGFLFYAGILLNLFFIGRRIRLFGNRGYLSIIDKDFVFLWRLILSVYIICGMTAVINYKFINVLLFTLAGIIARAESSLRRSKEVNQFNHQNNL